MLAAFAFWGCASDPVQQRMEIPGQAGNDGGSGNDGRLVTFHARPAGTKVAFGQADATGARPTLWTGNDSEVKVSLNYSGAQVAGVTPSNDFTTASFSANIDFGASASPYTFYAVSPSSAAVALSPSREAWKVNIPGTQTPTATSVDERAIIIAAASDQFTDAETINDVDLMFYHLTAYGRLSLQNLALEQGESLKQVELTFTTPVAGDWYWACDETDGTHTLTDYGASSTLTINTSSATDIWFGCAPVDVSEQIMVVRAYTSAGLWERYVEFPQGQTFKFEAGEVAVFSVDMAEAAGAEFTEFAAGSGSDSFTLVTDASTLMAGDEILIVYKNGSLALGALNESGNFRDPVEITISGDGSSIASAGSATILTLETGGESGTWSFRDGSEYLASASSKNYLVNSSTKTSNASWTISIASTGLATITAKAGASSILSYNTGSPRFSCYSNNNQQKTSIYRRSGGGSGPADPANDALLQKTIYGCYLGSGQEWEYTPGIDQITRSYNANDVLTFTLIRPDSVDELEITGLSRSAVKGDDVTVTVHWRSGLQTVLSQSYNMSVIKEDGPKVWIGDGSGQGFIVKK